MSSVGTVLLIEDNAVILLDLALPDSSGLDTLHRVPEHAPCTPVVILSGHDDEAIALDAARAGAADYLPKQHADSRRGAGARFTFTLQAAEGAP